MIKGFDIKIEYVPHHGYAVFQKKRGFFVDRWSIISTYRGSSEPFYFNSYEVARDIFLDELKYKIALNSRRKEDDI